VDDKLVLMLGRDEQHPMSMAQLLGRHSLGSGDPPAAAAAAGAVAPFHSPAARHHAGGGHSYDGCCFYAGGSQAAAAAAAAVPSVPVFIEDVSMCRNEQQQQQQQQQQLGGGDVHFLASAALPTALDPHFDAQSPAGGGGSGKRPRLGSDGEPQHSSSGVAGSPHSSASTEPPWCIICDCDNCICAEWSTLAAPQAAAAAGGAAAAAGGSAAAAAAAGADDAVLSPAAGQVLDAAALEEVLASVRLKPVVGRKRGRGADGRSDAAPSFLPLLVAELERRSLMGVPQLAAFTTFFKDVATAPLEVVTDEDVNRWRTERGLYQLLNPSGTMAKEPELIGTRLPRAGVPIKREGADKHHFNVSSEHIAGADDAALPSRSDTKEEVGSARAAARGSKGGGAPRARRRQQVGGKGRPCSVFEGTDLACATFHGFSKALEAAAPPPTRTHDTFPFQAHARDGGLQPRNPQHALIAEVGIAGGLEDGVRVFRVSSGVCAGVHDGILHNWSGVSHDLVVPGFLGSGVRVHVYENVFVPSQPVLREHGQRLLRLHEPARSLRAAAASSSVPAAAPAAMPSLPPARSTQQRALVPTSSPASSPFMPTASSSSLTWSGGGSGSGGGGSSGGPGRGGGGGGSLRPLAPAAQPGVPAGYFLVPFVVGLFSEHWCMMRMAWIAINLFKQHAAFASLLGTDFSGAQLDALFALVKTLGMTCEDMEEFHELWMAELERESPEEHAVVLRLLGEGKDLLEAMRHIFAKRGGAAVRARAAEYKALTAGKRAPLRSAVSDELFGNPLALAQPAKGRFKRAATAAGVDAGMRRGAASRVGTGAALPMGFAVHGMRVAAALGAPAPATLEAAISAGASANGEWRTRRE
jgi:hypothetical protein